MPASYLSGRKIPLALCYHAVSDRLDDALAVTPKRLREQMAELDQRGYRSVTFSELEAMRRNGHDTDGVVALTFDDGYASTLRAYEILSEFGFVGTVYVLPPTLGSDEPLSWPGIGHLARGTMRDELLPMTWEDVESLSHAGWEIGSHTLSHPKLPAIGDTALAEELDDSRRLLMERLGSCGSVAYPFGAANARVAAAARAAGYANGTTLSRWHRKDEPFLRPRVGVYLRDDLRRFRRKIAPWSRAARALTLGRRVTARS